MAKQQASIKFPDNLKVRDRLEYGDGATLASKSGFSEAYISDILAGRRRMVDKVKAAIVDLLNERKKLEKKFEETINQ
jgi:hypothetical protein